MKVLLILIYISFISLGLPDGLLGASWLSINIDFEMPNYAAGLITLIVSIGTVVSSINCQRLLKKFGTGPVTVTSVFLTAIALVGNSFAPNFLCMCVCAIPLGLGAGAVDSALNYFVALFYKAKHMNWLHCFWGIGATGGPLIMSLFLSNSLSWRLGFRAICLIQLALILALLVSLPTWKKYDEKPLDEIEGNELVPFKKLINIKGVKLALIAFFCYCSAEAALGLWGSSFLVLYKGLSVADGAMFIAFYYFGITIGRLLSGFLTIKIESKKMIYLGIFVSLVGAIVLVLPFGNVWCLSGTILVGLGFAPIYPAMLHETPRRFGQNNSRGLMGIQMAAAYVGTSVMPPLFGLLMSKISPLVLPVGLIAILIVMLMMIFYLNKAVNKSV